MRIAYLECRSGISGDMLLGALLDAGVPLSELQQTLDGLDLGLLLQVSRVNRSGITATKVEVAAPHEHHGRTFRDIRALLERAPLSEPVRELAQRAFRLLAECEGRIHGIEAEQVHFHEVGALDSIADVVACAAGCCQLGIERWICSPLNVGGGTVHCAHGVYAVPAPATLDLLQGAPVYSAGPEKELVTPTGAALVRGLAAEFSRFPEMTPQCIGYGAGSGDFPGHPNVLRLTVGETAVPTDRVGVLETVIDDCSPQVLAFACERLLEAGALDAFQTPVSMKKGRLGVQLTVLCPPERAAALRELVFRETTTIGLRYREEQRFILERRIETVSTEWGDVRRKVVEHGASPELEDCRRLALEHDVPLRDVLRSASRT